MAERDPFEPLDSPLDRDQDFGPIGAQVVEVLKGIYDPEIPVPIWDLGLISLIGRRQRGLRQDDPDGPELPRR